MGRDLFEGAIVADVYRHADPENASRDHGIGVSADSLPSRLINP